MDDVRRHVAHLGRHLSSLGPRQAAAAPAVAAPLRGPTPEFLLPGLQLQLLGVALALPLTARLAAHAVHHLSALPPTLCGSGRGDPGDGLAWGLLSGCVHLLARQQTQAPRTPAPQQAANLLELHVGLVGPLLLRSLTRPQLQRSLLEMGAYYVARVYDAAPPPADVASALRQRATVAVTAIMLAVSMGHLSAWLGDDWQLLSHSLGCALGTGGLLLLGLFILRASVPAARTP